MIQATLAAQIRRAIAAAQEAGSLPPFEIPSIELERPARKEHGDWAWGGALGLAKAARMPPRDVAAKIVEALGKTEHVGRVEIAGPGFINLFLTHAWLTGVVAEVEEAGESWGRSERSDPERIQVEFVSANPTGPLHVGHGRWAAVGDALASVLEAAGDEVAREFYINDYGSQMDLFARSIEARYAQHLGRDAPMPEGGYMGAYVKEIGVAVAAEAGGRWLDASEAERLAFFRDEGERRMLDRQREVLERFGVRFDVWLSERSLHESGAVEAGIDRLRALGHVYEKDGALWLRTTDFGDDKDRVLVRATGEPTYMAPDVAYFLDKLGRGFTRLVYLWGADHHGYVARMVGVIRALGGDPEVVEFIIGQLVNLTRAGEPVRMSKRTGEIVTFDELLDEVGKDAARYTFLRQGIDTAMDFDIEMVVRQTQENPVYYVQYAHARICSIMRHAEEQGIGMRPVAEVALEELQHESELDLIRKIAELPEAVQVAANLRAPHRLTRYAEDLAGLFHGFYRDCRVVSPDPSLTQARLHLCKAAQIALRNVLAFLGVGAPEQM